MNIEMSAAGFINLELRRNGRTVAETGWFNNLLLDTFFNRFAANNTMFATAICRVGTGTSAPTNSDTALVSAVASQVATTATNIAGTIDAPNNRVVIARVSQHEFTQGSVVANLGEVGFEFAPSSGGLHSGQLNSRSLIKDSFGTPTPLTVTADDQLVVNYRFELYIPLTDRVGTVVLGGTTHNYVGRVASGYVLNSVNFALGLPVFNSGWFVAYQSTSVFGAHGADPTNEIAGQGSSSTNYLSISGGKEFEPVGSINVMNDPSNIGIKCITIPSSNGSGRLYKYEFTPVIPKTSSKILKLRFRMTLARA